jgi:outer membrane biosynthesis protein TonB
MSQSLSQIRARRASPQRPPRPTTARGPRAGLVVSFLLHAALIGATYFTWSRMLDTSPESHAVPVDLITITEKTNVAAMAPPPPPTPPKIEVPQPTIEAPPPPHLEAVEPAPVPPLPQFKIKPEPKKAEDQPKPPDQSKKQPSQDFAALLNKLTATPKTPPNAKVGPRIVQGIGAANAMTADIADALKSQIYQCWSPPVGAPNANDLVVDFDVTLNQDGSVASATSPSTDNGNPNLYNRAAGTAARSAIYKCAPYKLPADRYSQWREINPLRFDPRQMMNQ